MTKIQFWKQFTTSRRSKPQDTKLYSVWQRYNFESNLQPVEEDLDELERCIQYDKDTILKAIYNDTGKALIKYFAVFSMTKIQFWKQFTTILQIMGETVELYSVWQRYNFESNLQLSSANIWTCYRCIQYDKDTILKAIYNISFEGYLILGAVFSMTKIQFWKQFTTHRTALLYRQGCIQYDKDTILKAIYNF